MGPVTVKVWARTRPSEFFPYPAEADWTLHKVSALSSNRQGKVPAELADNHRTSIFAPLQVKWAPPPATLAVCQLAYRQCRLVISPVNVRPKPKTFLHS